MAVAALPGTAGDSRSFTGIYVVAFVAMLPIAAVAQALAVPWRSWLPGAEAERSLVGGVRSAVYTFMSHLS